MGMTPRQLLFMVELPAGDALDRGRLRVATVIGVGTATIAAAIGAGGLGEYIFRGLSMVDTTVILAGAIPAGCPGTGRRRLSGVAGAASATSPRIVAGPCARRGCRGSHRHASHVVLDGSRLMLGRRRRSKNFTEQVVLGN